MKINVQMPYVRARNTRVRALLHVLTLSTVGGIVKVLLKELSLC